MTKTINAVIGTSLFFSVMFNWMLWTSTVVRPQWIPDISVIAAESAKEKK